MPQALRVDVWNVTQCLSIHVDFSSKVTLLENGYFTERTKLPSGDGEVITKSDMIQSDGLRTKSIYIINLLRDMIGCFV